jgi:hypothetical protein
VSLNPQAARLVLDRELPGREIVHYASDDLLVTSHHHTVYIQSGSAERRVVLPESLPRRVAGVSRLARRALRLDKCNVVPVENGHRSYVILRNREAFHFDGESGRLTHTLTMKNCRNVLHGAVTVLGGNEVVFGEYGSMGEHKPVPLYRSTDGGRSWICVHEFAAGTVRHVHGCYWDPFEERYWIFTGDSDAEVRVLLARRDFTEVTEIAGGSQEWRACTVMFEEDAVYWIMDSERENSHLIRFDRRTRTIDKAMFPGPVWYTKRTSDGVYLAATTCEGPGVHDRYAHIYATRHRQWHEVARFEWDGLPKGWLKFGVIASPAARNRATLLFGEALRGLDGRAFRCRLATDA